MHATTRTPRRPAPSGAALLALLGLLASPAPAPAVEPEPLPAADEAPQEPAAQPAPARPSQPPPSQPPPAEPPPVAPVPEPAVPVPKLPPPRPEDVFSGRQPRDEAAPAEEEHSWFDASHTRLGRLFFAPAIRIDRFFSDETDLDPERAESFARVRTGVRLRQDGRPQFAFDTVADLKLPGVNRWLDRARVVFTGSSDELEPTDPSSPGISPLGVRQRGGANVEFRFGAYRGIRSSIDLGAGLLVRLPFGAFTRVRYRMAVPIEDRLLARFSTEGFWRTDMHLGTRWAASLESPITPSALVRLAGISQVAQRRTRGIEYGGELVYSYAFTGRSAIALGTDAVGSTRTPVVFDKYRLYTRYRQDVLRRWLFVELEPEVGWPWKRDRGRYRAYAITLRFEVQLSGERAVEDQARARAAEEPDD